jgi:hypothetical protein
MFLWAKKRQEQVGTTILLIFERSCTVFFSDSYRFLDQVSKG